MYILDNVKLKFLWAPKSLSDLSMAGLDVAAGVVGIAGAGIVVAKGLFQMADAIDSAGEEVRVCASDTDLFSQMLLNLSSLFERSTSPSYAAQRIAEDPVDVCEQVLKPFQGLIAKMEPLLERYRESQHQIQQLGLRFQWYFRHKSKITFHQQALGQLKATLSCLLASLNLQESWSKGSINIV